MINVNHLEHKIIVPVLKYLGDKYFSKTIVDLLIGTSLVESELQHLVQLNNGPAVGIYQMEPDTYEDCWNNFIISRHDLSVRLRDLAGDRYKTTAIPVEEMIGNLNYATAMARIKYWRSPLHLPKIDSQDYVEELAIYWKDVYNSSKGKGDPGRFIILYNAYRDAYQ